FRDDAFLAHGLEHEPHAGEQPILLTTSHVNPNGAKISCLVDGALPPDLAGYDRAVFTFDGHDEEQLAGARQGGKDLKPAGDDVTSGQPGPDRRWVQKPCCWNSCCDLFCC